MSFAEPLIHIGYHKTGTTWLQRRIFADKAFGFWRVWPKRVIDEAFVTLDPFDYEPERAASGIAPFLSDADAHGAVAVISHERLSGFDLLGSYDAPVIADRLHAAFPQGRILIVIREQRAMMLSMYKQHIKKSGTERPEQLWRQRSPRELRRPGPRLEVYEYHRLIGRYQKLFGKDRVLVLPYELLQRDPRAFVREICSHVGVPAPDVVPSVTENVGVPGAMVAALRVSNAVLRSAGLFSDLGGPIRSQRVAAVRRRAIRWLTPKIPQALSRPFDRRLAAAIERIGDGRFSQSNSVVRELTGLDLGALGYMVTSDDA